MRTSIPGGYYSLIDASHWLNENSNPKDKIMAANTQDLPYYTNRTIFWDYRIFFLNDSDVLYYLKNYYSPKYILVLDYQFVEDWNNWNLIPNTSPFVKLLNNESVFKKVYSENSINIYEFLNS
jgi:hypothetical protein